MSFKTYEIIIKDNVINNFSSSIGRNNPCTSFKKSVPTGKKIVSFGGPFSTTNMDPGDKIRISDGSTTVTFTVTNNPTTFALSQSQTNGTVHKRGITGSTGGQHAGGKFNPSGNKLAVKTKRHGGAGSTDWGVDIYTSGSPAGWTRTNSLDHVDGTVRDLEWFSDTEIYVLGTTDLNAYSLSEGNWVQKPGIPIQTHGGYDYLTPFSPNNSRIGLLDAASLTMRIYESSSAAWSLMSTEDGNVWSVGDAISGFTWCTDNDYIIGMPTYDEDIVSKNNNGLLEHHKYESGEWKVKQACEGHNGTSFRNAGYGLHWHAPSGHLIVGARNSGGFAVFNLLPSASYSNSDYLPTGNPHLVAGSTVLSGSSALYSRYYDYEAGKVLPVSGIKSFRADPGNENRILGLTAGISNTPWNSGCLFTMESGSGGNGVEGWKFKTIFPDVAVHNTNIDIDISNGGKYISSNDEGHFGADDTFFIFETNISSIAGGGSAPANTDIAGGDLRALNDTINEFKTKIEAQLDITVVNNGDGTMTLTPGGGKTITITEDPSGDGEFGKTPNFTTVTNETSETVGGCGPMKPFRFLPTGVFNLRSQTSVSGSVYRTFLGKQQI